MKLKLKKLQKDLHDLKCAEARQSLLNEIGSYATYVGNLEFRGEHRRRLIRISQILKDKSILEGATLTLNASDLFSIVEDLEHYIKKCQSLEQEIRLKSNRWW